MRIIGPEPIDASDDHVHTIDVWFSQADRTWIVQRLNGKGDPIGAGHRCRSRAEADACLMEWLRRHPETHLATPHAKRKTAGSRGARS